MKTLKFNLYDEPMEVCFFIDEYEFGGMYVGALNKDKEYNKFELYGDVSINIHGFLEKHEIFADTNNSSELIKAMFKAKLIEDTKETRSSGFCTYPKVKLTKKFWEYVFEKEEDDEEI